MKVTINHSGLQQWHSQEGKGVGVEMPGYYLHFLPQGATWHHNPWQCYWSSADIVLFGPYLPFYLPLTQTWFSACRHCGPNGPPWPLPTLPSEPSNNSGIWGLLIGFLMSLVVIATLTIVAFRVRVWRLRSRGRQVSHHRGRFIVWMSSQSQFALVATLCY